MPLEFAERISRIPAYPVAGGYSLPDDVALLASNESPDPPLPQVADAGTPAFPYSGAAVSVDQAPSG